MKKNSSTVLITGGSSGIGFELAKIFASHGHELILVARDRQKLEKKADFLKKTYAITVTALVFDLADPQSSQQLFASVQKNGKQVDILVNNAGFGMYGAFATTDWKTEQAMIQTNIQTLTELTKLFLPPMTARNSGKILNIASTAAFQPGPFMAVYYATKAYVLSFSEALAQELSHTGVTVTTLCPGPTATVFSQRAGARKLFENLKVMDAATVALAGYKGLMKGKSLVIPGLSNKVLMESNRFLPRSWIARIVKKLQAE